MATTSYKQGRNLLLYVNNVPVGCSKTTSVEMTTSVSNSTTKCDVTGGVLWTNNSPEENSWKMMDNGVIPVLESAGMEISIFSLSHYYAKQTLLTVLFEDNAGVWFTGQGYISSLKASGDVAADATYDVTIDGTGPLVPTPSS